MIVELNEVPKIVSCDFCGAELNVAGQRIKSPNEEYLKRIAYNNGWKTWENFLTTDSVNCCPDCYCIYTFGHGIDWCGKEMCR